MKIVVGGYIISYPLGGMTWHHLNYLAGLHEMGHEVWFYEDSGEWNVPYNPTTQTCENDPTYGINYMKQAFASVGLPLRWCYYSQQLDQYFGLQKREFHDLLKSADLLLCVSGITPLRADWPKVRRTCVIDTDPVFTQLRMMHDADFLSYYRLFDATATFGTLIGTESCNLPTHGLKWIGTNQPIAMKHWPVVPTLSRTFSTLGKWEHSNERHVEFNGQRFLSSKGVEWMKLIDIAKQSPFQLEMAMASLPDATRRQFESAGWSFIDVLEASVSTDGFRSYIQSRAGELTVAKQIYSGLPSGWFSDRSSAFLASGRPVITQASGFERWLPTGEGLFSFQSPQDVLDALRSIDSDYARHARAARAIAEKYMDSRVVLSSLLDAVM